MSGRRSGAVAARGRAGGRGRRLLVAALGARRRRAPRRGRDPEAGPGADRLAARTPSGPTSSRRRRRTSTSCSRSRRSGAMVTNGVDRPTSLAERLRHHRRRRARRRPTASTGNQGFGVDEDVRARPRRRRVHDPHRHPRRRRARVHADHRAPSRPTTTSSTAPSPACSATSSRTAGHLARGDHQRRRHRPEHARHAVHAVAARRGRRPDDERGQGARRARRRRPAAPGRPAAPFGVRLDPDRVEHAPSTEAWKPGSVVLVEGSDLVRADIQARFASDEQAVKMRARALEETDRIVGRLLDHVEPDDLVMVVGPTPPQEPRRPQRRGGARARLRARAAALDHHAARRLRQPHRRRADRAHLLRARPTRRDGRPADGDRRRRRLARRAPRRSS